MNANAMKDAELIPTDRENLEAMRAEAGAVLASGDAVGIEGRIVAYRELEGALTTSIEDLGNLIVELAEADDADDEEINTVDALRSSQLAMRRYTRELRSDMERALAS